jgi:uncharacterized protein YgbK (DUF1537 family)
VTGGKDSRDDVDRATGGGLASPLVIPNAASSVRTRQQHLGLMTVIMDDDPTGSQAVHDLPVVLVPDADVVASALREGSPSVFVLTNTRSLPEAEAVALTSRLTTSIREKMGNPAGLRFVSRSDSTLRGHIVAEVEVLKKDRQNSGYDPYAAILMAPAYFEAGRVTAGGIQWARVDGQLVPVAETEFARDATFGYAVSDIGELIRQRSAPAAATVGLVSLTDIRSGGVGRVVDILCSTSGGQWLVIDALDYSDYEVVALAVMEAESKGFAFAYRTGPSFIRALLGVEQKGPLTRYEIYGTTGAATVETKGLIVIGSHTNLTNRQLARVLETGSVTHVEMPVALMSEGDWESIVETTSRAVAGAITQRHVVLSTSRHLITGSDRDESLAIARRVSRALSEIVRRVVLGSPPRWIIAKGGITSHDLAATALGIRRAWLLGQIFPGQVSVFRPEDAVTACEGIPFVVFPGNVGDQDSLAHSIAVLDGTGNDE